MIAEAIAKGATSITVAGLQEWPPKAACNVVYVVAGGRLKITNPRPGLQVFVQDGGHADVATPTPIKVVVSKNATARVFGPHRVTCNGGSVNTRGAEVTANGGSVTAHGGRVIGSQGAIVYSFSADGMTTDPCNWHEMSPE